MERDRESGLGSRALTIYKPGNLVNNFPVGLFNNTLTLRFQRRKVLPLGSYPTEDSGLGDTQPEARTSSPNGLTLTAADRTSSHDIVKWHPRFNLKLGWLVRGT